MMGGKDTIHKILLVEDDLNFGRVLKDYLSINGLNVTLAKDGLEGWKQFQSSDFDICILDVMMPKQDGFTLAKRIREKNKTVALLFLTARSQKEDQIEGFKLGADDYITKPFDADILLYKIKAKLSRVNTNEVIQPIQDVYIIGIYTFNYANRELKSAYTNKILSPKEAQLLRLLCTHRGELLHREKVLKELWNEVSFFTARSMDVYIAKLRKYLNEDETIRIVNFHNTGYRLEDVVE